MATGFSTLTSQTSNCKPGTNLYFCLTIPEDIDFLNTPGFFYILTENTACK